MKHIKLSWKNFITIAAPDGFSICFTNFSSFPNTFVCIINLKIKLALTKVISLEKLLMIVGKTWINIMVCIIMIGITTILIWKILLHEKILFLIVFNELD